MTDHRAEQFPPSAPIVNTAEKVRRFPSTSRNRKRVIISGAELFPLVLPPSVLYTIFAEILACTSGGGETDSFMNFFAIGDEDQKTIVAVLPSVLAGIRSPPNTRGVRLALSSCQKEQVFIHIASDRQLSAPPDSLPSPSLRALGTRLANALGHLVFAAHLEMDVSCLPTAGRQTGGRHRLACPFKDRSEGGRARVIRCCRRRRLA